MYWLYMTNTQKGFIPVKFDDGEEAERYADLLYHFGQSAWLINGIYEYNPVSRQWNNIEYY